MSDIFSFDDNKAAANFNSSPITHIITLIYFRNTRWNHNYSIITDNKLTSNNQRKTSSYMYLERVDES